MEATTPVPAETTVLAEAMEQWVDAVIVMDAHHTISLFNAAAERLWGLPRDQVLGRHAQLLLPAALRRKAACDLERLLGVDRELTIQRRDGQTRSVVFSLSRVRAESGTHYTALVKDITHAKQRHRPLLQMARAIDASDTATIVAGPDGRVVAINGGVTRMLGYELADLLGRRPGEVLAGRHTDTQTLQVLWNNVRSYAHARQGLRTELLIYTKAARPLWVSVMMNPVFDESGILVNVLGVMADITTTKMHEVLQNKVLAAMVRELPVREVMTLLCREVERIAPEVVATVLGIDSDGRVRPLAAPSLPEYVSQAMDGLPIGPSHGSCGTAAWRGEPVVVTDIATDPLWHDYKALLILPLGLVACWSSPIKSGDGHVMGTFAFYFREQRGPDALHQRLVDVCLHLCALMLEREQVRTHIHKLVFFDTLTGLPNRGTLHAKADRAIFEAQKSGTPMALVHLDLDRFKHINDSHGHAVGDALLRELAGRFKNLARETDTVGRLASDEFVMVLPHCSAQQAAAVAERLCEAAMRPVQVLGVSLQAGASIGIAISPEDGTDVETLMRHADIAMYEAKSKGHGGYRFFSAEMNRLAQERTMLEADLRQALHDNHLALHYQPQVDAGGARLLGVEALLRWQHTALGAVPPMRFVALAEECGLIGELSQWVLRQACRQLADWRARGIQVPGVAINLSASNFQDPALPGQIAGLLQDHGLQPAELTLEMTESVMLDPDPVVLATLKAVHAQGVHLSMDDFGTGYSSLSSLHRLPINELKLDQSFVQDLEHSEAARALTTSVLRIGESLSLRVVAEGVETEAQRLFLAERHCSVLQGYLFARPMPAAALEEWLMQRGRSC